MNDLTPLDPKEIIRSATTYQRQAADPTASVLVNASAGTGKTKVLTDRILGLLLTGSTPDKILALTFTKAAAGEMHERLLKRLAHWAICKQDELAAEITQLTEKDASLDEINQAQSLFAQVLDTPGGLKIQTIHSFCQSLLARFPLEADLPPNFQLIEDRTVSELLRNAQERVLHQAHRAPNSALALAVLRLSAQMQDVQFSELMAKVASSRRRIEAFLRNYGGVIGAIATLKETLGVDQNDTAPKIIDDLLSTNFLSDLQRIGRNLIASDKATTIKRGNELLLWLSLDEAERRSSITQLFDWFLTKGKSDEELAHKLRKTLATRDIAKKHPEDYERLNELADEVFAFYNKIKNLRLVEINEALLTVAEAVLSDYGRAKAARIALDYEDLIAKSANLLSAKHGMAWVMYKLDGGINHVLIDEAQDTSPEQWQIVQRITDDFFSGDQGKDLRTLFAVGDFKQSIFSFQGANPAELGRMRDYFGEKVTAADLIWRPVNLDASFRSAPGILGLVDQVFSQSTAGRGLFLPGEQQSDWRRHLASRQGHESQIELWPLVEAQEVDGQGSAASSSSLDTSTQLAQKIADRIHHLCLSDDGINDPNSWLPSKKRRLEPGDFMILLQKRGSFASLLNRSLRRKGIPVAGLDRLALAQHLAVEDLVALGRSLLLPEDDLTLATVLKGPFLGLTEDELYWLAAARGEGRLWATLYLRSIKTDVYQRAYNELSSLASIALSRPPYEFFCHLLYGLGGLGKLTARMGEEAADPVQEFLSLALNYEREHPPSLEGFLHWFTKGSEEVKRDMDQSHGEVRIMTVHGSKGLQSPVVVLADSHLPVRFRETFFWKGDPQNESLIWVPASDQDSRESRALRNKARGEIEEEKHRLLYVGLTRAEDRLWITGIKQQKSSKGSTWHSICGNSLQELGAETKQINEDELLCLINNWSERPNATQRQEAANENEKIPSLPEWFRTMPNAEPSPPSPLAASRPEDEPAGNSPLKKLGRTTGIKRGILTHSLLEHLPALPKERWEAACDHYLKKPGHSLEAEINMEIKQEVLSVLNHPEFGKLFSADTQTEVPLVGLVGHDVVSGRIDRLLVTESEVWVLDYKTNRPSPATSDKVPSVYRKQLSNYKELLKPVYPNKLIRTFLLWTDETNLMEII